MLALTTALLAALTQPPAPTTHRHSRRSFFGLAAGAAATAALPGLPVQAAETTKIYFGAGCFWHVQHEFVGEEVATLKRGPGTVTAVSGYAGGQRLGDGGKVCYHNMQQFADYGKLGHAEAVQIEIPTASVPKFADKYFSLFGSRGYRHDPQDRGGEYRSVLGLPGGVDSPLYPAIEAAAAKSEGGMKLFKGRGDEPDTLGDKLVIVYDSNKVCVRRAPLSVVVTANTHGRPRARLALATPRR